MQLLSELESYLIDAFVKIMGINSVYAEYLFLILALVIILTFGWVSNLLVKRFLLEFVRSLAKKTKTKLAGILLEEGFFLRISHVAPAFVISSMSGFVFVRFPVVHGLIEMVVNLYLVCIALWIIDSIIDTFYRISLGSRVSGKLPVKGICQAIKVVVYVTGVIFILSILLDKSPLYFFSGLGALTAVLLLVFKDVILGLVAGIQLTANNMVRRGDWIEMPKYGADGDVVDVSLTTIKVQNFDKTITTIPSYALVSDAFKNWRGMSESGGRRIKRCILLDLSSVRFLSEKEIEELQKIELLNNYLSVKRKEIGEEVLPGQEEGMAAT